MKKYVYLLMNLKNRVRKDEHSKQSYLSMTLKEYLNI